MNELFIIIIILLVLWFINKNTNKNKEPFFNPAYTQQNKLVVVASWSDYNE
jgi:hypothetical protein